MIGGGIAIARSNDLRCGVFHLGVCGFSCRSLHSANDVHFALVQSGRRYRIPVMGNVCTSSIWVNLWSSSLIQFATIKHLDWDSSCYSDYSHRGGDRNSGVHSGKIHELARTT